MISILNPFILSIPFISVIKVYNTFENNCIKNEFTRKMKGSCRVNLMDISPSNFSNRCFLKESYHKIVGFLCGATGMNGFNEYYILYNF